MTERRGKDISVSCLVGVISSPFMGDRSQRGQFPTLKDIMRAESCPCGYARDSFRVGVGPSGTCQGGIPPHFPLQGEGEPTGGNDPHLNLASPTTIESSNRGILCNSTVY